MKYCLCALLCLCLCLSAEAQLNIVQQNRQKNVDSNRITLNGRVHLRRIFIIGNKVTKRNVITREMSVSEGDSINTDSLSYMMEINRKRIYNLTIFNDVIVTADTLSEQEIDWTIRVKEQWYLMPQLSFKLADRNFNVWWDEHHHDIRRSNLGIMLKNRNFCGNLEQLSATVQVGYTQKFGMEYFKPYIDKAQKHGIGASFFIAKNEETYYTTDSNKLRFVHTRGNYIIRQFEAAIVYVYRPGYAFKHQLELRYRDYQADDTVLKLNPDYYLNGSKRLKLFDLTYRFDMNKVDNWSYPLQGNKIVAYAEVRAGWEGFKFQSLAQVEAGHFYSIAPRLYMAHVLRARLTAPERQPYIFRNALGSETEMVRGYEYYVIDGAQYGIFRTDLKYELLNVVIRNIPIRFISALPIRLYPKIYADLGYVSYKYPGNSYLNNRLLCGYGIGLDIWSAYDFKLRIEYSFNHLLEKGLFLHLNSE